MSNRSGVDILRIYFFKLKLFSAIIIFVMIIAFLVWKRVKIEEWYIEELKNSSDIIIDRMIVPLDIKAIGELERILLSLKNDERYIGGIVYDADNRRLVTVENSGLLLVSEMYSSDVGITKDKDRYIIKRKVIEDGRFFGTIYLFAFSDIVDNRFINITLFSLLIYFVIIAVLHTFSAFIQNKIQFCFSQLSLVLHKLTSEKTDNLDINSCVRSGDPQIFIEVEKLAILLSEKNREISALTEHFEEKVRDRTKELFEAKREAEVANRSKAMFFTNMSHEIRTPLNSVMGYSDILIKSLKDSQEEQFAKNIKFSAKNLMLMLEDIIELSKSEGSGKQSTYDRIVFKDFINNSVDMLADKISKKNTEIIQEIDSVFPEKILIDEVKLRQIFVNLLGFALEGCDNSYVKLRVGTISEKEHNKVYDIYIRIEDGGFDKTEIFKAATGFVSGGVVSNADTNFSGYMNMFIANRLAKSIGYRIDFYRNINENKNVSELKIFAIQALDSVELDTDMGNDMKIEFIKADVLFSSHNANEVKKMERVLSDVGFRVTVVDKKDIFDIVQNNVFDLIIIDTDDEFDETRLISVIRSSVNSRAKVILISGSSSMLTKSYSDSEYDFKLPQPLEVAKLLSILKRVFPFNISSFNK